jgi:heme A synthase
MEINFNLGTVFFFLAFFLLIVITLLIVGVIVSKELKRRIMVMSFNIATAMYTAVTILYLSVMTEETIVSLTNSSFVIGRGVIAIIGIIMFLLSLMGVYLLGKK